MSEFDKLIKNLDSLEKANFDTGLNIEKFFLKEKEGLKKFIAHKSGLPLSDIDLMVDSAEELYESLSKKIEEGKEKAKKAKEAKRDKQNKVDGDTENNPSEDPTVADEEKKKLLEEEKKKRKEEAKKKVKEYVDLMKEIYKDKLVEFIKQLQDLKKQIKDAAYMLFNKFKELAQKLVTTVSNIAMAVPSVILKVSFIPFNIPDALMTIFTLVQLILDIVAVLKDVVPFLYPLRYLPLVTDKENLAVLGTTLNPVIEGILATLSFITGANSIVVKLIEFILALIGKTKESAFRKATKKLKKLGHLKKLELPLPENALNVITNLFWGTDNRGKLYKTDGDPPGDDGNRLKLSDDTEVDVYSFSPDDVGEIVSMLDSYKIRNNRVVDYRQKKDLDGNEQEPEDVLRKLKNKLADLELPIQPKGSNEFEQFVYDIQLPDGTIVYGVSEDSIDFYRQKYNLQYDFQNEIDDLDENSENTQAPKTSNPGFI